MAQDQSFTAVRKMIRAEKNDTDQTNTEDAITLALARVGQGHLGLSLNVASARQKCMTLADLPEIIPDHALRLVIEGTKESTGLMILCPDLMGAVTQMQTMGKLCRINTNRRHPTRLDAAMVVDFVDATLGAIEQELCNSPELVWAGGFRYASWIEESRPLETLLDEIPYRVWTLDIRLGNGDVHGMLLWVIPEEGRTPRPKPAIVADASHDSEWDDKLAHNIMESHVTVDAVLHRFSLPLSALMALHVGMDVPLHSATLGDIHLESQRRQLSSGRLGQTKGQRAVLLTVSAPEATTRTETVTDLSDPLEILKIA